MRPESNGCVKDFVDIGILALVYDLLAGGADSSLYLTPTRTPL